MGRMPVHREDMRVVLGPCPGCYLWTLEYDKGEVAQHWVNNDDFSTDVEFILLDHLDECAGLQEIVASW